LIDSHEVALLLFAVAAGEALAFLLALGLVWRTFDAKLKEQAVRFGEKMDSMREQHHREMNEVRGENRDLQTRVDTLTDFVVASGISIQAGENVTIGQDVIGRDKTRRAGHEQDSG
jgi:hypothetical protein